jgi:tetratricopeptide (TPR) repeat protein
MRNNLSKVLVIGLVAVGLASAGWALAMPLGASDADDEAATSPDALEGAKSELSERRIDDSGLGAAELFVEANGFYAQGAYEQAIALYQEILGSAGESGYVYFNLGNAFLRNGELGRAIASYLRGRRSLPRDEDVEANLQFARSSTKDAIEPPGPSPLFATLFFWHFGLSTSEMLRLLLVLNGLFWTTCVARLFYRDSEVLRWTFMVILVLLVGAGSSAATSVLAPRSVAVVIPQEIEVHTGPSVESVVRFKVHAGTELRIEDSQEGWLRIALPTGEQGWIERSWAEIVAGVG